MGNFSGKLIDWIKFLIFGGIAAYFIYLFTIYTLWNAPKGVFTFGFVCALLIVYFGKDSKDESGELKYKSKTEYVLYFLFFFVLISWLSALALSLLDALGSSNSCYGNGCEDMRDNWIP